MTHSNPRILLANASSSIVPTHTIAKGIRKMLLRHIGLNVSVSIHQTMSPRKLSLLPPFHTSILPLLHFDRRLTLAPSLPSPHGHTLLLSIPFPSHARIPPDSPPFHTIRPSAPKLRRLPAQCPWIPRRLVAPPSKSLLTFLLPFRAMFPWSLLQIPPFNPPTLPSACDQPSLLSPVLHPMVQIH